MCTCMGNTKRVLVRYKERCPPGAPAPRRQVPRSHGSCLGRSPPILCNASAALACSAASPPNAAPPSPEPTATTSPSPSSESSASLPAAADPWAGACPTARAYGGVVAAAGDVQAQALRLSHERCPPWRRCRHRPHLDCCGRPAGGRPQLRLGDRHRRLHRGGEDAEVRQPHAMPVVQAHHRDKLESAAILAAEDTQVARGAC